MMARVGTSSLLLAACMFGSAFAATPPPESPFPATTWTPVSKSKPATTVTLGSFELRFEETTLAMVIGAVGRGDVSHQGDAGDSIYWLCYTAPNERIWIIADGEMGGSGHAVTEVTAQRMERIQATDECPALPKSLQSISVAGQISLGSSERKALRILGQPSHRDGPWWSFDYQEKVPGNCEPDGFDRMNWLLFKTEHGHIVTIHAGQVTSC